MENQHDSLARDQFDLSCGLRRHCLRGVRNVENVLGRFYVRGIPIGSMSDGVQNVPKGVSTSISRSFAALLSRGDHVYAFADAMVCYCLHGDARPDLRWLSSS